MENISQKIPPKMRQIERKNRKQIRELRDIKDTARKVNICES